MYRETLNNQAQINHLSKMNFGKMTYQEKKLNRADLHDFKAKKLNTVNAMIPGINNVEGVASNPLKRGAIRMMQYADDAGVKAERLKGQIFFQSPKAGGKPPNYFDNEFQNPLPH